MAKIKHFNPSGKKLNTREIKSISGDDYKNSIKERTQEKRNISKQNFKDKIKSEDVIL